MLNLFWAMVAIALYSALMSFSTNRTLNHRDKQLKEALDICDQLRARGTGL